MDPGSMKFINEMSAKLGYSSKIVTQSNLHELMIPARMAFISVHLAKCYFEEKIYDQAILWLKVALDSGHPDVEIIKHNMQVAYDWYKIVSLNNQEELVAQSSYKHKDISSNAYTHYKMGELHGKYRNWEDAIKEFEKGRGVALEELLGDMGESYGTELDDAYSCSGKCSPTNDSGIFEQ